jgi:hypothetical protein
MCTVVPRSQESAFPLNPTVGPCLRPSGGSREGAVSYERSDPVRGEVPQTAERGTASRARPGLPASSRDSDLLTIRAGEPRP